MLAASVAFERARPWIGRRFLELYSASEGMRGNETVGGLFRANRVLMTVAGSARATMNSWEPVYEVVKWFSRTLGLRLPVARKTQQIQQLLDSCLYGPRHLRRADKPSRILCCSIHCRWAQVSVFSLHSIPAQANLPQQSLTKLWNSNLPLYPLVVFHQSPRVDSCIVRLCCIWN